MFLGRVVGCVWSTVKDRNLEGLRLLIVQPLASDMRDTGKRIVCTDCVGAGAGETIYWVRSKEAGLAFHPKEPPTDATVVGIVDSVHVGQASQPAGPGSSPAPARRKNSGRRESC